MGEHEMEAIYDRLRETEAQTREQNIKIDALCKRIDSFSEVVNQFFTVEEKRSERMWKLMAILVGAVVCMAIGPKATKEIVQAWQRQGAQANYYAIPWDYQRNAITIGKGIMA